MIRETIQYKFKGQRYNFEKFQQDIRESKIKVFSVQEIKSMLSS